MLGSIVFFNEPFTNIVTITFSSLIVIELLNVYSSVHNLNWKMIISSIFTFLIYVISIALLRNYFDTSYLSWTFCCKVVILTLASWLPLHVV
jgi:phospholipid-translocating ATPase